MKRYIVLVLLLLVSVSAVFAEECQNEGAVCSEQPVQTVGAPIEEIEANPVPAVDTLTVDQSRLHDRTYYQVTRAIDIFDAPGGNVVTHVPAGFNFITASSVQDGWVQINEGQWVQADALTASNGIISNFTGAVLPEEGLPYTMGWLLVNLHPSREPGGEPTEANPLLYRYTRVYLYATEEVEGYQWYQIGVNQWIHQHNVARVLPVTRQESGADTEKWVSIDLFEQVLIAYEGDTPIFATLIATGLPRWETREGLWHIYYRIPRIEMSWGTPGDDFYYLEEVPWTMFFDEGRALHGAYWHDGFGYRRSHGCVNLSITDAHWLYSWVAEDFERWQSPDQEEGPAVYIYHSQEYR